MIRLPAEWEEQKFVQLVFPHSKSDWSEYLEDAILNFVKIAKTIAKYQKCLIIAQELKFVKSFFKAETNLIFVKLQSNDTWSRDFGGITIEKNGKYKILDFTFNAWGAKFPSNFDNVISRELNKIGIFKDYKFKTIPFVLEGGAIESDGEGVILTTSDCLLEVNRNPHISKKQIEKKLIKYLGAKKVLWLNSGYLAGDDTDSHIDTLARLVSTNTIAYQSCDDENDEHYKDLKKMENELKTFTNLENKPYNLVALPWIEPKYNDGERLPATYANFLIINGAVLVPTYNDKNDKKALKIFKDIFPNRDIIGIDCSTLIKQHGSLHCVTMQYPVPKNKKEAE